MTLSASTAIATDLLVVGGGVAGVAAAIAASRAGLQVTLVEKELSPGGTATHGLTGTICGLFRNGGQEPGAALQSGIVAEVVAALCTLAPARAVRRSGRVFVLPYSSGDLQLVLERLVRNESGVNVYYGSTPLTVTSAAGAVNAVTVTTPSGEVVCTPAAVIDASGSGDLAALAGAGFERAAAEQLQLAGFMAVIGGLQGVTDSLSLKVPFVVARGIEAGALPAALRYTVFSRGEHDGEGLLKVNSPDEQSVGSTAVAESLSALVAWLAAELPEFSEAAVLKTSGRSFSREGRRIIGEYLLTADDVLAARKFPDAVVRGAWPMEIWGRQRGVSYRYPPDNDYYEIPAGCLKARGFTNLFMAGRCISVSHEALGSTRVIATCMALGEQAGLMAADCVSSSGK